MLSQENAEALHHAVETHRLLSEICAVQLSKGMFINRDPNAAGFYVQSTDYIRFPVQDRTYELSIHAGNKAGSVERLLDIMRLLDNAGINIQEDEAHLQNKLQCIKDGAVDDRAQLSAMELIPGRKLRLIHVTNANQSNKDRYSVIYFTLFPSAECVGKLKTSLADAVNNKARAYLLEKAEEATKEVEGMMKKVLEPEEVLRNMGRVRSSLAAGPAL
ncbi:MAG: hypothetical protein PHY92_00585 [Alphaproteobacteria bacterium]|nr:hypothetical protein [Alphaproteobacteria bacterium]